MQKFIEGILFFLALFVLIVLLFTKCTPVPGPAPDCSAKIDSTNEFWHSVIKNLQVTDTNYVEIFDTTKVIVEIIHEKDSINWIDSIRYNYIDSVVQIDTFLNRFGLLQQISIDSVRVDAFAGCGDGYNMLDDIPFVTRENRGTRWCVSGYPHGAMFYFDTTYIVTEIWVNTFAWNEGYTHTLNLYYYADLINKISTKEELYSKHEIFYVGNHLLLEVIGGKNSYTDIGEIKLFGYKKE